MNAFTHLANKAGHRALQSYLELDDATFAKRLRGILPRGGERQLFLADWMEAAVNVMAGFKTPAEATRK